MPMGYYSEGSSSNTIGCSESSIKSRSFNIGDRVVVTVDYDSAKAGMTGVVINAGIDGQGLRRHGKERIGVDFAHEFLGGHSFNGILNKDSGHWVREDYLKLVIKKTMLQRVGNYLKKVLDADTQALIRAGFINGDLRPTMEGTDELMMINFFANKDALVARAKEKIAEEEKAAAQR